MKWHLWGLLVTSLLALRCNGWGDGFIARFDARDTNVQRVEKGKDELSKVVQYAALPHGSCWMSALESLKISCATMGTEQHSRLSLQFTMCFNEMHGFQYVICTPEMDLKDCMNRLDTSSRASYQQFFLHTQDMCYYLEHQLWQLQTSNAVNQVTDAVFSVSKHLESAHETQKEVLKSQKESLVVQGNIIRDNNAIYSMVLNVKDVFNDVQASAMEQRQVVVDVFEKLSKMHKLVSWIHGEMSLLDMMGFYFACILFGFFSTSSKRTQSARFWVVLLVMVTLVMERIIHNQLLEQNSTPEAIQEYVWYFRKFSVLIGVVIIIISAAHYRDPQEDLKKTVNQLVEKMNAVQHDVSLCYNYLSEESDSDSISDSEIDPRETADLLQSTQNPVAPIITEDEASEHESNSVNHENENVAPTSQRFVRNRQLLQQRKATPYRHQRYNLRCNSSPTRTVPEPPLRNSNRRAMTPNESKPKEVPSAVFSSDEEC